MELPAQLYEKIESLSDEGGSHFDDGDYEAAVEKWMRALECVPAPKDDWEATHWLCASIGDAYYQQSRFDRAREFLLDALNAPGGLSSPFVFYRLGQSEGRLETPEPQRITSCALTCLMGRIYLKLIRRAPHI